MLEVMLAPYFLCARIIYEASTVVMAAIIPLTSVLHYMVLPGLFPLHYR